MKEKVLRGVNWIGAGFSLAWIAFFIVCMFVRTNFPDSPFAIRFLNGRRATLTLACTFFVALVLSMLLAALAERARHRADSDSPDR